MTVLYFAWVKERVGTGEETLALPAGVATVSELVEHLKSLGPSHAQALADVSTLKIAVNQDMADLTTPVSDADEVAFFPPMTGGSGAD